MLRRPRFKPHLHVDVVPGTGVFLLSEVDQTVLQGRLYEIVAPLLDGRTVEEVCGELRGKASPSQVFYTVNKLSGSGYLYDDGQPVTRSDAAAWSLVGIDPATLLTRRAETSVSVTAVGIDPQPLRTLLQSMQIEVRDEGSLHVVVADHYLRRELAEINRAALQNGRPWLLVRPMGAQIWVGPLFRPNETGCWECMAERIRGNSPVTACLESIRGDEGLGAVNPIATPATTSIAWGLAAHCIAGWIANDKQAPLLEGTIQTIDLTTLKMESHKLFRQPDCRRCGQPDQMRGAGAARKVTLESRRKAFTDGGYRALTPQETLDKYGVHLSPICGVVSKLDQWKPEENTEMHVYLSGHNLARGPRSLPSLKSSLRESSAGKGTNALQAKAGALSEAIERFSGNYRGDEPRRAAKFQELGGAAIHPNDCMRFSERQYANRIELNANGTSFTYIPLPFDPDRTIDWTPVWSLTNETERFLPTSYCYFNAPHECAADFSMACSNGNAAGTSLEDAILQGFFELVERDAVAMWWYNRLSVPAVDLASFEDPFIQRTEKYLAKHHRNLWALDLTNDFGIPVFTACSRRIDGDAEHIMFGFGAHMDPRIAMLRAVTELNQFLAHILITTPEQPTGTVNAEDIVQWLTNARIADHSYILPGDFPVRRMSDFPVVRNDDLRDDVVYCQKAVEKRGMELLVLDQTRPEIGMPVVKVFVPGMRHFWPRYAPGRLFDVPVSQGRLKTALSEDQMNPTVMFL